jgi:hypothetical protein
MNIKEIGCEDGRCVEVAQYRVQWRYVVSVVLNIPVHHYARCFPKATVKWSLTELHSIKPPENFVKN